MKYRALVVSLVSLALSVRSASAQADAVDDVVADTCTIDDALEPVARAAIEDHDPIDTAALQREAEDAGIAAPSVRAWVGRGSETAMAALVRHWFAMQRVTPDWARCAVARRRSVVAVALVPRLARITGVPQTVEPGAVAHVRFELPRGASAGELLVAAPDGEVARGGRDDHVAVRFARRGTYTLQVLAQTAQGPLPFATWHVEVGAQPPPDDEDDDAASHGPDSALGVLASINQTRTQLGLQTLRADPLLADVARTRAEELAMRGVVAHALTVADTPAARLARAHVTVDRVAENVARANSIGDASLRLDESPSHRANRIDPQVDTVGIGTAEADGQVYLVELYARRPRIVDR